jgi:hypothetical protein
MSEARLHLVFGTGQAGKCSCRATGRAGCRGPGGVPAPAGHFGGTGWRATDAADPEVAADAAKSA